MTDYTELIDDLRNGGLHGFSIVLKAADAIEWLQRERDAAITDVEFIIDEHLTICSICKNEKDYPMKGKCRKCCPDAKNNFEWRGVQNEL